MEDGAETGVGTMMTFVALMLMFTVVVSALSETTRDLEETAATREMLERPAANTGVRAVDWVTSRLSVTSAEGYRWQGAGDIGSINLTLDLSPGSQEVDLDLMMIEYASGSGVTHLRWDAHDDPSSELEHEPTAIGNGTFGLYWVRGNATSDHHDTVMQVGDVVRVHFEAPHHLAPRDEASLVLLPNVGSPVKVNLRAPEAFGDRTYVGLR